jgi:hypothetical protein
VTNNLSVRLAKHASNGFSRVPLLAIEGTGREVLDIERTLKTLLSAAGVRSCHDTGVIFDGSTESHFTADVDVAMLLRAVHASTAIQSTSSI